jgi:hypothetical protein
LYGSESWTLTRSNEENLRVFERKVLRRIFGAVYENGLWHMRHNGEFYELFSEPDIDKTIKMGRVRWSGHAV